MYNDFDSMGSDGLSSAELALIDAATGDLRDQGMDVDFDADDSNHFPAVDVLITPEPFEPMMKSSGASAPATTKIEQSRVIYADIAGKGHGRKMTIQRFQDVLGMTPGMASNYYQRCKKETNA